MTIPLQELGENSTPGKMLSAPRHGPSVLSGLVVCCLSDHRPLVGSSNTSALKTLRYSCQREALDCGADVCQSLSGAVLESFLVARLWQAVSPASIALSLAATADLERERKQLDNRWQQRLARSRYEVEQSRRGYAAVDPKHRLVARELERRWDEALREDEPLQAGYARFQGDCPRQLSSDEREQIVALSRDPPGLWYADSTRLEDRQTIARLWLEQVLATVESNTDRVEVELRWAGGFVSRGTRSRPVATYEQLSNCDELVEADEWWLANLAAELAMPTATRPRWQRVGGVALRTGDDGGRSLGCLRRHRQRRTRSPPSLPRLAARVASALPGRTHHSETKSRRNKNDVTVPRQELGENSTLVNVLSAPRHGLSVLSGLVVCGRCGHRMLDGYSNTSAVKSLRYSCQREAIDYGAEVCQSLSGAVLESFLVARL
jgi:hypothetical protein